MKGHFNAINPEAFSQYDSERIQFLNLSKTSGCFSIFFPFFEEAHNYWMGYTITDYFEASKRLAECIKDAERLKDASASSLQVTTIEKKVKNAANRMDELVEIFTWETTNTDNIRTAFLSCAADIEEQLTRISQSGLYPDPYNGTSNKFQLVEEIIDSLRIALSTTGTQIPPINIQAIANEWKWEGLIAYVRDMQRQLNNTTFDNLLEALRYFEKSSMMLSIFFKLLDDTGLIKKTYLE